MPSEDYFQLTMAIVTVSLLVPHAVPPDIAATFSALLLVVPFTMTLPAGGAAGAALLAPWVNIASWRSPALPTVNAAWPTTASGATRRPRTPDEDAELTTSAQAARGMPA